MADGSSGTGQLESYLLTQEVAERYRTTPGTVRYWRSKGYGPRGVRVGKRTLYPLSEVLRFDAEQRGAST